MSVDDNMLKYLMDVKSPKWAWDMFASVFLQEDETHKGQGVLSMWKTGHIAWDYNVMMTVVKRNLVLEDLRHVEANERGGAIDEDGWTQRQISQQPSKFVSMH